MAQQTGETVAIACTSGSAALNYAPAIAEAYYQRIPLLVITADRPLEWIDQGEGQTMRQRNIYANFIKSSYEIFQETIHPDELRYNTRMFNEAINITQIAPPGPVHVNIPLREPLYTMGHDNFDNRLEIIDNISPLPELSDDILDSLADIWNRSKRKLILTGILPEDIELKKIIKVLSDDPSVIVMTETTSNIYDPDFINNIDRFIMSIDEDERYSPDLLLTLGSNIVSKKIKYLLRKWNPVEHWDVDESDKIIDTYKSLTKHIKSELKSL
jgi:2-succinyl-5-enolpyruvyl-6-hydroxy-3-cyclohexene-1-carboxylate synthase